MWRFIGAVLITVVVLACGRSEPKAKKPKELETVDVGEGYDAGLSTDTDQRERRIKSDIGGVLPSDFPADMPIFSPSSIVDFGQPGSSGSFVVVDTPVPRAEVTSSLGTRIQRSGWTVESIGENGNTYAREGRRVRVILTDLGTGTRIRYEY